MVASPALYTTDGPLLVPGPLTVGPWSADAQHGGPVAALMARAVESAPAPDGVVMQAVRLTVELMRPVPLVPLEVSAAVTRPGKKVQIVDATISAEGVEVAKARALRIRVADVPVPSPSRDSPAAAAVSAGGVAGVASPTPVGDADDATAGVRRTAFADAVDLRFVKGSWNELGPVTMWTRLKVPVVDEEAPSPMQRTAAAADFGNGVSRVVDFNTHIFINPDLTVALSRVPRGEWIGFDVVSRLSGDGWGQAEAQIFDAEGPVGRSVQSLLVEGR